ncbi:MAG: HNH endonuclease [Acidobacteria bacterium]|nr:HNH endonuclease [Acidobacteriota bacterium]MBI3426871.1 HNH endonuclease [Acidobacteriota bacterium]
MRVRLAAGHRCGYCLTPQHLLPWELELEHILASANGGTDDEENLWLACRSCNSFKGTQIFALDPLTNRRLRLFNPRRQKWWKHFKWSADGAQIIGLTAPGRASVLALRLNNIFAVAARREWVSAGWYPPKDNP